MSLREALPVWGRVAALSFGGPAGQIAVMHRILVEERAWVSERQFLHALNYCMLLPGPEAQQLATYIGWLLNGVAGGLVAGLLFVLPGFLSILGLSIVYAEYRDTALVDGLFFGLKAAVLAIVVEAVVRIGKRALRNRLMVGIAAAAFVAIFFLGVPFPAIILGAGGAGAALARWFPIHLPAAGDDGDDAVLRRVAAPTLRRAATVVAVWGSIWAFPLVAVAAVLGGDHVLIDIGLFFSKVAVVTFGGAYAVLAYVAQQAVAAHGWLRPGEMLDGLGMAETTPGPLIQVVQFVGFLGAYRDPQPFSPLAAGIAGSVVTAWVTFAPCFLWIFLGAPYIERLRHNRALSAALSTITAAVVGVILNLAVWFALHVCFATVDEQRRFGLRLLVPDPASADWAAIAIAAFAFVAMFRLHWGMLSTLGVGAAAGLIYSLAT